MKKDNKVAKQQAKEKLKVDKKKRESVREQIKAAKSKPAPPMVF